MDLSNLTPAEGSIKNRKRIGRGEGSGKGGTSTRGHKGAKSRSGYKSKRGFEGGQMPLFRRIPKFGFRNINRKEFTGVNLDVIERIASENNLTEITLETLIKFGVTKKKENVKILGDGELNSKVDVKVHAFSKKAKEAIEAKGGSTEVV